jgi:hypothetical protein
VRTTRTAIALVIACGLLSVPSWASVFLLWTQPDVPTVEALGVDGLVIPWGSGAASVAGKARRMGHRAYIEVGLQQASAAAEMASQEKMAGIMLDPGGATQVEAEKAAAQLRLHHPKLAILVVDRTAKQPQMRGNSIVSRHGVLETSSPTEQPWLDCNLALVRYDRTIHPMQVPLYQFDWELPEPLQQKEGPSAADYALAAAEAGAFRADVILGMRADLQTGLAHHAPPAVAFWSQVKPYLGFAGGSRGQTLADIAVVPDNDYNWFEPANLMARHNILFRILTAAQLAGASLHDFNLVIMFAAPNKPETATIVNFASHGGMVVLVDAKGAYPWHSAKPVQTSDAMADYAVGQGSIIELLKPVDDPDSFASDIRRLMDKRPVLISLWNALTTIAVPYRKPASGEMIIDLVNYAQDPLPVQVQVKGVFHSARYETPGDGCCRDLKPGRENGFTQFVVPGLATAGRVYLNAR